MKYLLLIILFAACEPRTYRQEGQTLYKMGDSGWDVTAKDTAAFAKFLSGAGSDTFLFSQTGTKVIRPKALDTAKKKPAYELRFDSVMEAYTKMYDYRIKKYEQEAEYYVTGKEKNRRLANKYVDSANYWQRRLRSLAPPDAKILPPAEKVTTP